MGLTIKQYYNCTQRQLYNIIKGYHKRSREQWEQTRLQCFYSIQWGKKVPKLTDFMPFEWDAPTTKLKTRLTREEMAAKFKK